MSLTTTERTGTFRAVAADGGEVTVEIWQEFHDATNLAGPQERVPGLKRLRTVDGRNVNRTAQGHYEIVGYETITLKSSDPAAP